MIKNSKGFTLLELMVAVAILGVLASVAIPAFDRSFKKSAVNSLSEQLEGSFRLARISAMSTGEKIYICPVDDVTRFDINSDLTNKVVNCLDNWSDLNDLDENRGWVVFSGINQSGNYKIKDSQDLVQIIQVGTEGDRVLVGDQKNLNPVFFFRRGTASKQGTIRIAAEGAYDIGKDVILSYSGRVRSVPVE